MLVCGIPSLLSVIFLVFLPETPKYLVTHQQFDKAKAVLQKIYVFNTGSDVGYPVSRTDAV